MFLHIVGLLPIASVSALVVVAIFNLGYFWRIGLHFIGLIDLSNFAYSLALALSSALFLAQLSYPLMILFEQPLTPKREMNLRWRSNIFLGLGGFLVIFAFMSDLNSFYPKYTVAIPGFFGFVFGGIGAALQIVVGHKKGEKIAPKDLVVSAFVAFGVVFTAGLLACDIEMRDNTTYQISTKSEEIAGARILRSSSSGFVITVDGKVNFIPQAEVKKIKSSISIK